MDKKRSPSYMLPTGDSLKLIRHIQAQIEETTICHANENKWRAGIPTLISDKVNFKSKTVTKDKDGHLYNDKGINSSKYNNYKYMHLIGVHLIYKAHTNKSKESSRQQNNNRGLYLLTFNNEQIIQKKINKETSDLKYTLNKMD